MLRIATQNVGPKLTTPSGLSEKMNIVLSFRTLKAFAKPEQHHLFSTPLFFIIRRERGVHRRDSASPVERSVSSFISLLMI